MPVFFSPAKINLFLRLIRKRSDGYHDLQSLFRVVDLGDEISLEPDASDKYRSDHPLLGWNSSNLVRRAVDLFRELTGIKKAVSIIHRKKIPMEAGLGGGSGNAATVLWGLNRIFDSPLSEEEMRHHSLQLGSDVPFFFSGGTAICSGRGEKVVPLSLPDESKKMFLVKPEISLSTKEVYLYARNYRKNNRPLSFLLGELAEKRNYSNDLEESAFLLSPSLCILKENLLSQGYDRVFMTGSGSGLICIGDQEPRCGKSVQIFPLRYIRRDENCWYSMS